MDNYGGWIMRSTGIGASLGGVAGSFCAAYIMATMDVLNWTGVGDTVESVVVVFIFAVMVGSLCTAIGGLAGLVLGFVSFPLGSFTKNVRILPFRVKRREGNIEKRDRAS
jgi:hypothetical protein